MDDEGRDPNPSQLSGPVGLGVDRVELPGSPLGMDAPLPGQPGQALEAVGIGPIGRRADYRREPLDVPDEVLEILGTGLQEGEAVPWMRKRIGSMTGPRHDRRERRNPLRVPEHCALDDHPAHREAGQVGPLDPEVIEHGDRVVGHLLQAVPEAPPQPEEERSGIGQARFGQQGGAARIPVLHPDDTKTAIGEHSTELGIPVDHLGSEARNQKDRSTGRIPDFLVCDQHGAGGCESLLRHPVGSGHHGCGVVTGGISAFVRIHAGSEPTTRGGTPPLTS